MGNIISLDTIGERISMSNGLTSVFLDVLGLSGTHWAQTDAEKRMNVRLSFQFAAQNTPGHRFVPLSQSSAHCLIQL